MNDSKLTKLLREFTPEKNSFATLGFTAGALASTAEDLRKWIDHLFRYDFLAEETLQKMINYLEAEDPDVKYQIGYGLGMRVLNIEGDTLYGHTGTIPGFGAAVFHCPKKDYSIAISSNFSMFEQTEVLKEFVSVLIND